MLGAPVEGIVPLHQDLADVRVARVLEVKQHPNADRVTLCLVDVGGSGGAGPVEVVCGAPNVQAGKKNPYPAGGAVLPGGAQLERKKNRGGGAEGTSRPTIELRLGADHAGGPHGA